MKNSQKTSLAETIQSVENHLRWLRESDNRPLTLSPEEAQALGARSGGTSAAQGGRVAPPSPAARPPVSAPAASRPAQPPAAPIPFRPPGPRRTGDPEKLKEIAARIASCTLCPLHKTRTRTVPGQGHPAPEILFIGEGPGREEDAQGLAFIGRAGALLTRLIVRMGFTREEVFIANVVKCRPTEGGLGQKDRAPAAEESAACLPYLREQIAALRPRVIVTLGNIPLEALTGKKGITRLRGQWLDFESVDLMPTYHPSYLLRGGGEEKARFWEVWEDMCEVLKRLGRPVPEPATPRSRS